MQTMISRHKTSLCLTTFLLMLLAASTAFADTPGRHPAYLHARSDLARARTLLELQDEQNFEEPLHRAHHEVSEAIGEIDRAAMWDRKDIDDHPKVDVRLHGHDKFREIAKLLRGAQRDIDREEDNPAAREWRNRAHEDIERAMMHLRNARLIDDRDDIR